MNEANSSRAASRSGRTGGKLLNDPLWYKDAIIYELHVKAFFDSSNDGLGDFAGLSQKLDYLTSLGINTVWLLPFYPSPLRDDGYDIADYRSVHPNYGTLRDFKVFLKEAHKRGLRVITELVINHTSDQHPWFQAARRAKPGSAKRNYYLWSDTDEKFPETRIIFCDTESSNWQWDPVAEAYYWHRFYSHQPDLNLNNPRVVREVIKVLRFWFDLGVDGLRLDAVPYLCVREETNNENLPETHQVIKQIRKFVDDNFHDRMLLAEANQWPDDVREYFGDGDECHMAFHFPLMPRIFISLRREDREPIIDILKRTPEIPDTCQWGLFLRNHDELTLEMVTTEERDFMWSEYAADSRMRLNLGIRRRLAPLVENSPRRLELLNSMLLSFPGTPVVYYGDELAMGDNIFLGDRDGVRTPMQWSSDRNAGFSRADPARLYLPPIMDPVYGYQAVNVEAQERNPSSFLNFMKRMFALRKQYKAFGRGSLEFLHPRNKKVLAYLRKYRDEVILCVVNLSRFCQPAELDLSEFEGWHPLEIFGRTEFPRIGSLPYFLTLAPHAFYWFKLEPEAQPLLQELRESQELPDCPTIAMDSLDDEAFMQPQLRAELEEAALSYFERQSWFQKGLEENAKLRIMEVTKVGVRLYFALLEKVWEDKVLGHYFLAIRLARDNAADVLAKEVPESIIAIVRTSQGSGVIADALFDKSACQIFLQIVHNSRRFVTREFSNVVGSSTGIMDSVFRNAQILQSITPLPGTSSTKVVKYGEQLLMKMYRHLDEGPSSDLEIGHFLSLHTNIEHIPQLSGWIDWILKDGRKFTIGICREFVKEEENCRSYLQRLSVENIIGLEDYRLEQIYHTDLCGLFAEPFDPPKELADLLEDSAPWAKSLGSKVAEYHAALGTRTMITKFAPAVLSANDLENISSKVSSRLAKVLDVIGGATAEGNQSRELAQQVIARGDNIVDRMQFLTADLARAGSEERLLKVRCTGALRIKHVLNTSAGQVIFDFERDHEEFPELSHPQKSPIADLGSLIHSVAENVFKVIAEEVLAMDTDTDKSQLYQRAAIAWVRSLSRVIIAGYREASEAGPLVSSFQSFAKLTELFLLQEGLKQLSRATVGDQVLLNAKLLSLLALSVGPLPSNP